MVATRAEADKIRPIRAGMETKVVAATRSNAAGALRSNAEIHKYRADRTSIDAAEGKSGSPRTESSGNPDSLKRGSGRRTLSLSAHRLLISHAVNVMTSQVVETTERTGVKLTVR